MRHKITSLATLVLVFSSISVSVFAQDKSDLEKISKSYSQIELNSLSETLSKNQKENQRRAFIYADLNQIPKKFIDKNGSLNELQYLTEDNIPVYYKTENSGGATTIKATKLYNGGSLGINIQGQNMIAGVWDGSAVRSSHLDLAGRIVQKDNQVFDNATASDHPVHVTGTIVASGANNANAKGIAFQATAWANDWNNDQAEVVQQAAQGLLLSNHSYGYNGQAIPKYYFGAYIRDSKQWDDIMVKAPYYLMVVAAGNDRNDNFNSTKNGYDLLTGHTTSKNNVVIGAVNDVPNYTSASSVQMSSFSNWGPTDDGRIKPDFVAKGVNVLSTGSKSDTAYATLSGTSMASPMATGGLLLLQQYFKEKNGYFMKAATLKGLAIHNTDEAGINEGPDYAFGWGLLNIEKAAKHIKGNGINASISEYSLEDGKTFTQTVTANGTEPLIATISWTDPSGNINTGTVDLATPVLVNDLDIRLTKATTSFLPWKLNPADVNAAATKGDNLVDPIEVVKINNATGAYTITVSHKGTLSGGKQNFSLLVSGIGSSFNLTPEPTKTVCNENSATYNVSYVGLNSNNTTFTYSGLPTNASLSFSKNTINANGTFTATIENLKNVAAGTYTINIIGTNGTEVKNFPIELKVFQPSFTNAVTNNFPANSEANIVLQPALTWSTNANAQSYKIQIASDANFTKIIEEATSGTNSYTTQNIINNARYYWRVKPMNSCGEGSFGTTTSFDTQNLKQIENSNNNATPIGDFEDITSTINVTESISLSDVNVYIDISHTSVQELYATLKSPSGTIVTLIDTICGENDDMQVTFDDQGKSIICLDVIPTLKGVYLPKEVLSAFNGQNSVGAWTLSIGDNTLGNKGSLNKWSLQLSEQIPATLSTSTFSNADLNIWPNPVSNELYIQLKTVKNATATLTDMFGRIVLEKHIENTNDTQTLNVQGLSKGMYFLSILEGNSNVVRKIIIE